MNTETVSPLPGPTFKQQRAEEKHSQVLTETPQKKILEDWNKNKIGEEKRISIKGEPLTENQGQQTNACKKKMKQMMNVKEYLKNVLRVTIWEKIENYGTDAQVVEFGFMRSVAGGTLQMVTCATFASRWPSFPKIA